MEYIYKMFQNVQNLFFEFKIYSTFLQKYYCFWNEGVFLALKNSNHNMCGQRVDIITNIHYQDDNFSSKGDVFVLFFCIIARSPMFQIARWRPPVCPALPSTVWPAWFLPSPGSATTSGDMTSLRTLYLDAQWPS